MDGLNMVQSHDDESGDIPADSNLPGDGSGPVSRSSVTHVAYIVSKFDDIKRDLVRQIGFQGILDLPQITKVDRKFTLWLLTNLDAEKKCIIINGQCVTDVIDFEVARILGIPCGSREVCALDPVDKKSKIDFIQHIIGSSDSDKNSLTAAEHNVTAEYALPMSKKEEDSFKVSFVVWVMGHLLAPTKKHNIGGDQFWGSLLVPDEIKQFNWAAYVMEELFIAARDVQYTLKQKKPITTITGCSILLQILYFEAIPMGTLSRPRGISPRIKAYDSKSLSLMIAADKASSASGADNASWGSSVCRFPHANIQPVKLGSDTRDKSLDDSETDIGNKLIKNFGSYVRDKFGQKVSGHQAVALSWFHARCTQHLHQLRLNIQQDTIDLVAKLVSSSPVHEPTLPRKSLVNNPKVRQAHSEPSTTIMHGRNIRNYKRAAPGSASSYKHRGNKKPHVSSTKFCLPETLLSGVSISDEHAIDDEISDSEHHSRAIRRTTVIHMPSSGREIEVPLFDLGIDFNTEDDSGSVGPLRETSNIGLHIEDGTNTSNSVVSPNVLHTNDAVLVSSGNVSVGFNLNNTEVPNQPADVCGNANVLIDPNVMVSEPLESLDNNDVPMDLSDIPCTGQLSQHRLSTLSMNHTSSSTAHSVHKLPNNGCSTPVSFFNVLTGTPPSGKTMQPVTFTTPDQMIKGSTTSPGTLSKIMAEGDLVERMTRFEDTPNINIKPWDHDYSESPIKKQFVGFPKVAKSPWSYNFSHREPPIDIVDKFFEDVSVTSPSLLNRTWLAHSSPRHIELEGSWIHQTFVLQKPLGYDICDIAIRRLKQLDDMMYSNSHVAHWRHILESEFAMLALAEENPYNRKSIKEQFIGSSISYPLEDCRMIVVPAFILLNWSCYFFDFQDKRVHVIDPLYNKDQAVLFEQIHHPNVSKIAALLANCFEMFFENWYHKMDKWDINFVQTTILDASSHETGLLTLLYIREFDGCKIHNADRESFLQFKKAMLYELMCLSENHVKSPVNFTITIDD